ncbi:hypothetical protein BS50DRAFT_566835 [Corynespora cassiicola Philippines]|uniref:Uncharacterized protein n=1 Tax=Corynespora cassiicola Philippines TaxID=1448308 RepID=A0A2T2P8D7_CORCC|nr:hypothetical protein BS50DRAFT_566835 [Corynespora cassiicola Philippines]
MCLPLNEQGAQQQQRQHHENASTTAPHSETRTQSSRAQPPHRPLLSHPYKCRIRAGIARSFAPQIRAASGSARARQVTDKATPRRQSPCVGAVRWRHPWPMGKSFRARSGLEIESRENGIEGYRARSLLKTQLLTLQQANKSLAIGVPQNKTVR